MAKHDRITVVTDQGQTIAIVASGAGWTVDFKVDRDWVTVAEYNAAQRPDVVREARVAVGHVVSVTRDRHTPERKAIRPRRKTTED